MTFTVHQNTGAPNDTDLQELVDRFDLVSKVRLLTGATAFTLAGDDRIGLAEIAFSDGPSGVRGLKFTGGDPATLFPNATLLAGTWDEKAAEEVGRLVAEEAKRQHIDVVLGPTINLHRSPLGGRLFEAYSEDPLLTGKLAAGYVRGVQAAGIGACLKHLIANEAETQRTSVDNHLDEATLRSLYLLPFEIAIEESDPWTLMAAYNDVNGIPATEQDHVNNGIVKGEWGYTGLLMSDWFATKSAGPAANGGLDLVMPGPSGPWGMALVAAVRAGEVDESVVDDHLRRLLRLAARVGALGRRRSLPSPTTPEQAAAPDSPERAEQLCRLAVSGMTVLTNNDATLPLDRASSIALIGRHAVDTIAMGGGSAQVTPPYTVSIADGLAAALGDRLVAVDGVEVRTRSVAATPGLISDPVTGEPGMRAVFHDADGGVILEQHCRTAEVMTGFDDDLPRPPASVRLSARVHLDGPALVGVLGVGDWELVAGGTRLSAQIRTPGDPIEAILRPPAYTEALSLTAGDLLDAVVDLKEPSDPEQTAPAADEADEAGGTALLAARIMGLVARQAPREPDAVIADAVTAAQSADVAVVVVGLTDEQESESADKSTLALPGRQDDLVRAVAAAARRTVVVINAATPVLMPWLADVNAVLVVGLPGQEAGHAVAAALLGDSEPTGRLVCSYPSADGASPAWSVTPTDGRLDYAEGLFIGYRGHEAGRAPAPLFWFGHGLGYGAWEYGAPSLLSGPASLDGSPGDLTVLVPVSNIGTRRSREVVQVYLAPADDDQPVRLAGFAAVQVEPGATATVPVACDRRLWRRWDTTIGGWTWLAGGELLIARGLGDIRRRVRLT